MGPCVRRNIVTKRKKNRKSTAKKSTKIDEAAQAAAELKNAQETVMPIIEPEIIVPEPKAKKAVKPKTTNTKTPESKTMNTDNTSTDNNTDSKETNVSDSTTPTRRQRLRNWSQTVKAMDFKVTNASVLNRKIEKAYIKEEKISADIEKLYATEASEKRDKAITKLQEKLTMTCRATDKLRKEKLGLGEKADKAAILATVFNTLVRKPAAAVCRFGFWVYDGTIGRLFSKKNETKTETASAPAGETASATA